MDGGDGYLGGGRELAYPDPLLEEGPRSTYGGLGDLSGGKERRRQFVSGSRRTRWSLLLPLPLPPIGTHC